MLGGTTTTGRIGAQNTVPIRLRAVSGFQNRLNDVVYCPPLIKNDDEPPTAVVYFGGDVQVGENKTKLYLNSKTKHFFCYKFFVVNFLVDIFANVASVNQYQCLTNMSTIMLKRLSFK